MVQMRAWKLILPVAALLAGSGQRAYGQIQSFSESFDGTGMHSSDNVLIHGFDNDGWILAGSGSFSEGGFSVNLRSRPEQGTTTSLARYGTGNGSFREQITLRDLTLGDVTGVSSPDSTSSVSIWAYVGDAAIACAIGKTPAGLFSSKTTAHCATGFATSEVIEVPEGSNVSLGLDVDVQSGTYLFEYDPDIDDDIPPVEIGPISRTFPEATTYYTLVRMVAAGQGTVEGRIDHWTLIPHAHVEGDFGGNGILDVEDVTMLARAIRESSHDRRFDLNADGALDIVDLTHWIHALRNNYFGDADLDGEFNSIDLVLAFQAGEYEDAMLGNSTWSEGDWDANGEFATSDLVLAFQDGGYDRGRRMPSANVPEPSTLILVGILLTGAKRFV